MGTPVILVGACRAVGVGGEERSLQDREGASPTQAPSSGAQPTWHWLQSLLVGPVHSLQDSSQAGGRGGAVSRGPAWASCTSGVSLQGEHALTCHQPWTYRAPPSSQSGCRLGGRYPWARVVSGPITAERVCLPVTH